MSYSDLLSVLIKAKPNQRKAILRTASVEQINFLSEAVINLLHGTYSVSDQSVNKLKPCKNGLRLLAKKSASVKSKKDVLIKHSHCIVTNIIAPLFSMIHNSGGKNHSGNDNQKLGDDQKSVDVKPGEKEATEGHYTKLESNKKESQE